MTESLNRALQKPSVIEATLSQENSVFQSNKNLPILAFGFDRRQLSPLAVFLAGTPGVSWEASSSAIYTWGSHSFSLPALLSVVGITLSPLGASSTMSPCKMKPDVAHPDLLILSWEPAHHLPWSGKC